MMNHLVCSRCFWTCYPMSFITGASFWQMTEARQWCTTSGSYFPSMFGFNDFRDSQMANESCPQELSTEFSLAYQTSPWKMVEVWEHKMNGHLCIIFSENWVEDLWCSLTWHTSHLSCWHITLYSAAHGVSDDVSGAGNRCLCALSRHLQRKIQFFFKRCNRNHPCQPNTKASPCSLWSCSSQFHTQIRCPASTSNALLKAQSALRLMHTLRMGVIIVDDCYSANHCAVERMVD